MLDFDFASIKIDGPHGQISNLNSPRPRLFSQEIKFDCDESDER